MSPQTAVVQHSHHYVRSLCILHLVAVFGVNGCAQPEDFGSVPATAIQVRTLAAALRASSDDTRSPLRWTKSTNTASTSLYRKHGNCSAGTIPDRLWALSGSSANGMTPKVLCPPDDFACFQTARRLSSRSTSATSPTYIRCRRRTDWCAGRAPTLSSLLTVTDPLHVSRIQPGVPQLLVNAELGAFYIKMKELVSNLRLSSEAREEYRKVLNFPYITTLPLELIHEFVSCLASAVEERHAVCRFSILFLQRPTLLSLILSDNSLQSHGCLVQLRSRSTRGEPMRLSIAWGGRPSRRESARSGGRRILRLWRGGEAMAGHYRTWPPSGRSWRLRRTGFLPATTFPLRTWCVARRSHSQLRR